MSQNEDGAQAVLGHSSIFTPEVIDDIHVKSQLGRYRMRGFSMFKKIPHWDELMFLPGTLTRFVIEGYREKCDTRTVLGARFAKKPIELDIPIYITGMSFGALSLEAKMALAKGASMAGTATCYADVKIAAKCSPDIIYLDVAEGGTGAGPHLAAEETGIPLMAAIPEARRGLEDVGLADEIDLVVAGGIRNGGDVAKCLALGATAVAIGHSALMALNCNKEIPGVTDYEGTIGVPAGQCYHCHTGRCPVGITTQDPELRKRLVVDDAANRVYNLLHTLTMECQMLARACGKTDVHSLEPEDLCALTVEASAMARVPLAGTNYIPGASEERTLARIERLLERHIENPIDYLPEPEGVASGPLGSG